ncbi:uncharacterized protein [Macrobrachium rosenbergii]|uniref:uncharacterized protein n=1 Tax=Macrobrachium rosenbergii TaxID=79674 RepID=UPI0034D43BDD
MDFNNWEHPFGDNGSFSCGEEHPQSSDLHEFQQDETTLEGDMNSAFDGLSCEDILSEVGVSIDTDFITSIASNSFGDVQDIGQPNGGGDALQVQCRNAGQLTMLETPLENHGGHSVFVTSLMPQPTPSRSNESSIGTETFYQSTIQNSTNSDQNDKDYPQTPSPYFSTQFAESQSLAFASSWHSEESVNNASVTPPYPSANASTSSGMETTVPYHSCPSTYSENSSSMSPTEEISANTVCVPFGGGFFVEGLGTQKNQSIPERPLWEHRGPRVCHLAGEEKKQHSRELAKIRAKAYAERERKRGLKANADLRVQQERQRNLTQLSESFSRMKMNCVSICDQYSLPVPRASDVTPVADLEVAAATPRPFSYEWRP